MVHAVDKRKFELAQDGFVTRLIETENIEVGMMLLLSDGTDLVAHSVERGHGKVWAGGFNMKRGRMEDAEFAVSPTQYAIQIFEAEVQKNINGDLICSNCEFTTLFQNEDEPFCGNCGVTLTGDLALLVSALVAGMEAGL